MLEITRSINTGGHGLKTLGTISLCVFILKKSHKFSCNEILAQVNPTIFYLHPCDSPVHTRRETAARGPQIRILSDNAGLPGSSVQQCVQPNRLSLYVEELATENH